MELLRFRLVARRGGAEIGFVVSTRSQREAWLVCQRCRRVCVSQLCYMQLCYMLFVDGKHMPLYDALGIHCKDELARLAKSPRFDELGIAEFSKRRILRAFKMPVVSLSTQIALGH